MNIFTTLPKDRIIHRSEHFFLIYDGFPVSPGHILIISNQIKEDFFSLSQKEQQGLAEMIAKAKEIIEQQHKPDGYNIGMNCGKAGGQTVMHFHCHVIPRYIGDMEKPQGGVRHCVEGKGYY
ncbi:MAG: HIT family protein [Ferruginibacter sp.]